MKRWSIRMTKADAPMVIEADDIAIRDGCLIFLVADKAAFEGFRWTDGIARGEWLYFTEVR